MIVKLAAETVEMLRAKGCTDADIAMVEANLISPAWYRPVCNNTLIFGDNENRAMRRKRNAING